MGIPEILYEDNHIIIVNKRSSDLVQGDGTGDESLDNIVRGYIKEKYGKPGDVFLGVVHRLDRPVKTVHHSKKNITGLTVLLLDIPSYNIVERLVTGAITLDQIR